MPARRCGVTLSARLQLEVIISGLLLLVIVEPASDDLLTCLPALAWLAWFVSFWDDRAYYGEDAPDLNERITT